MDYKTLLATVDRGPRSALRLEITFGLAEKFGAHVIGMFAVDAPRVPAPLPDDLVRMITEEHTRERREAEKAFREVAARFGAATSEWRNSPLPAVDAVCLSSRYSDLVIVGQRSPDVDEGVARDFVEDVVLESGRPVLIIPYAWRPTPIGGRVLLAWDGGQEAARAVTGALPLLARAELVQVVAFDPKKHGDHGEMPGADAGLYLARHGVKVTVAQQHNPEVDVGSQILSYAADLNADLIVMGGYGHSRARELILGGATRTLLESMTAPVLMGH